ncbi:hypothetical protein CTAYLR_006842 [Chrysophaeum taylorii]|uniref:Uncharacterized protein n=1 Tax=Chrysophaeum taylorii TaxID=2483200 RepID=A0AAD7U702_9STRA|nr:hypothetical protein CTAYLR_006842 [Chrysophaeum taylorii]
MGKRELLRQCEVLIKAYNPKRMTVESHADEFLGQCRGAGEIGEADVAFLKEVLYGVMGYKAALKVFMTCFFNDMMARVVRSDYTMYTILTYLAVFRLTELTLAEFRKFALVLDPDKMVNFLGYLFDKKTLEKSGVVAHWINIFDPDYVHDTLLFNLGEASGGANNLVAELKAKSNGLMLAKQQSEERRGEIQNRKAATVPVAPRLTKPNPRRVPEPKRIRQDRTVADLSVERPSTPGDDAVEDGGPKEPADDDDDNINAHAKHTHRSSKPTTKVVPMKLHDTRSTKPKLERELEEKAAAELDFDRFKAPAKPPAPTAEVRYNTAAILREEALLRQKREQEAARVEAFEAELRDASEFNQWQADMRARDRQVRLDQIVRTRVLAKASAEEAAQAKASKLLDNRELAEKAGEESRSMREQSRLEAEMTLMKHRHQAKEVREVRDTAPKKAVEEVHQKRSHVRNEVRTDLANRLAAKREEDVKRAEELAETVKKLRAEEIAPREYVKEFDPTETAGLGLLDEMSLVEMKERLKLNKAQNGEAIDRKRDEITECKTAQRDRIADKFESIKQARETAALQHRQAREQAAARQAALEEEKRKAEEEQLLRLVDKLASKRADIAERRKHLAEEEDRRAKNNLYVGASEREREQRNAVELLKGAERMARNQQTKAFEAAATDEATRVKARRQHDLNRARADQAQRRLDAAREDAVREARDATYQMQKEEIATKKRMYATEKASHRERMERITHPYAKHINDTSIARARRYASKLPTHAAFA